MVMLNYYSSETQILTEVTSLPRRVGVVGPIDIMFFGLIVFFPKPRILSNKKIDLSWVLTCERARRGRGLAP